jgi:sulfoxide reductase heme-binding subunit YedZ
MPAWTCAKTTDDVNRKSLIILKTALWAACLAPACRLLYKGLTGGLGANPIEFITLSTGTWTLVLILVTLSITPLRRITRQNWLIKLRRPIGLFAFFYAFLHFTTYIWLDKFFDFQEMAKDVAKRPFITAGFLAFILLIPLTATSTADAVRQLGGRNWQLLHRLIYITAAAGVVHYWWKVKADHLLPSIYGAVFILLMLLRLPWRLQGKAVTK